MYTCDMDATTERQSRKQANREFDALGKTYHGSIPLTRIDEILTANGFRTLEEGIYCGRDGQVNEQVGDRTYFSLSWHKMDESGRYEIVARVS